MYRSKCLKFSVLSIEHRSSRANRFFQTRHVSFFPDILPVVYIYTRYLHSVKRASEGERVATEFEFDLTFLLSVRQVSPLFFLRTRQAKLSATRITTHFRLRKFLAWPISKRNLFVYVFYPPKVKEKSRTTDSTKETRNKRNDRWRAISWAK